MEDVVENTMNGTDRTDYDRQMYTYAQETIEEYISIRIFWAIEIRKREIAYNRL